MKYSVSGCLLLMSFGANAQIPQGMDSAKMQQMMQQMQNVQNCMQNIDQAEMKAFEQRARAMEAEVKRLCALGQRDKAQSTAMTFGMEVAQSASIQQMKKCGESMKNFMPKMPMFDDNDAASELSHKHICDQMK